MDHGFGSGADAAVKREVWQTLRALNDAWTKGDPGDLRNYFHRNMVAITPTDRQRVLGADACVAGWSRFARTFKIVDWAECDPRIQLYGEAAVVTYYYDMTVSKDGRTMKFAGRDMFVLVRESGRWVAVANQFSPYPE